MIKAPDATLQLVLLSGSLGVFVVALLYLAARAIQLLASAQIDIVQRRAVVIAIVSTISEYVRRVPSQDRDSFKTVFWKINDLHRRLQSLTNGSVLTRIWVVGVATLVSASIVGIAGGRTVEIYKQEQRRRLNSETPHIISSNIGQPATPDIARRPLGEPLRPPKVRLRKPASQADSSIPQSMNIAVPLSAPSETKGSPAVVTPLSTNGAPVPAGLDQPNPERAEPKTTPPVLISHESPAYTEEALEHRIQGDVVLRITITEEGRVIVHGVIHGLGHGLDEEAIRSMSTYRFLPATQNGRPVQYTTNIIIKFQTA